MSINRHGLTDYLLPIRETSHQPRYTETWWKDGKGYSRLMETKIKLEGSREIPDPMKLYYKIQIKKKVKAKQKQLTILPL